MLNFLNWIRICWRYREIFMC